MAKFGAIRTATARLARQPLLNLLHSLIGESGCADDCVDSVVDQIVQVVHDDVWMGEVDDDLGLALGEHAQRIPRVDPGGERKVVRGLDGLNHRRADLALGAQHTHSHGPNPNCRHPVESVPRLSVVRTSVRYVGTGGMSDPGAVAAAVDRFDAAQADLAALSFDALAPSKVLAVKDRLETINRRQAAVDHRLTQQLTSQTSPVELGGKSWTDVLSNRLRIGRGGARRRLDEAEDLGPRIAMTGEQLGPLLPNVAAAQAAGTIGDEHVRIIRRFFADLPTAVDLATRQACEVDLARLASEHTPDALRKVADRLMALVHPDGDFSDIDRARRRHLILGKQEADGMSKISGLDRPRNPGHLRSGADQIGRTGHVQPRRRKPVCQRVAERSSDPE